MENLSDKNFPQVTEKTLLSHIAHPSIIQINLNRHPRRSHLRMTHRVYFLLEPPPPFPVVLLSNSV